MSKRAVDPRIEPLVQKWMMAFEFGHYHYTIRPLPKKQVAEMWAKCQWFHDNKDVTFWFGPTVGLSDDDVEAIVVHEMAHGLSSLLMLAPRGSVVDEQFCNMMARVCVPESSRVMDTHKVYGWATSMVKDHFTDDEREVLMDVMPHLIMRLSEPHRSTLIALFYDGKSLSDLGRELGLNRSTIMRRRDAALDALKGMYLRGGA